MSTTSNSSTSQKRRPEDFIFLKTVGEGSYSTVYLANEVSTQKQFAIKVIDKVLIKKENKIDNVFREKHALTLVSDHPFFVSLYCTFQDSDRLYFALSYAERGEILTYLRKLGSFDEECTQFYISELVTALEYLRLKKIVHRDLKPENILLGENMHIKISDFGSVKLLPSDNGEENLVKAGPEKPPSMIDADELNAVRRTRTTSFVGTAQYVSPEILSHKRTSYSCDLWALGCILYQFTAGSFPFYGDYEYLIFSKIMKLDYSFPDGFNETTKDLVKKLLVIDPSQRLGSLEQGGLEHLKNHGFFSNVKWDDLPNTTPPHLLPYLPARDESSEPLWGDIEAGFDKETIRRLLQTDEGIKPLKKNSSFIWLSDDERKQKLNEQQQNNPFHKFVQNNLILKQGFLEKRKGLFARKRMFLLTEGPRLYYVDADNMKLKGEVPWTKDLKPEAKNFKVFFVHTPNRTYYLEETKGNALKWCKKIEEVTNFYFCSKC